MHHDNWLRDIFNNRLIECIDFSRRVKKTVCCINVCLKYFDRTVVKKKKCLNALCAEWLEDRLRFGFTPDLILWADWAQSTNLLTNAVAMKGRLS